MRRIFAFVYASLLLVFLCGCWNYRGLDEMTIIAGMAIDKVGKDIELTFEIVDLNTPPKEKGIQPAIVVSRGQTVFEAIRNAKKRLANKLYFANAQIIMIGHEFAETIGIFPAIDLFLRDAEGRETMNVIISKEKSAKEILMTKAVDSDIISYALKQIVEDDNSVTASTSAIQLYQIYNVLSGSGQSLVLPAFSRDNNDGERVCEATGVAVFRKDRLIGYLTPEETKYYLFAVNQIKGGLLTFGTYGESLNPVSLEIFANHTSRSFSYSNNIIKVSLKPKLTVAIGQKETMKKFTDVKTIKKLEELAQKELETRIMDIIQKAQSELKADIFGFGTMIHGKNANLWEILEPSWDKMFPDIQVEVDASVNIINSALSN